VREDQMRELIAQVRAGAWDPDANLVPILAAEIPSLENGGLAVDGRSVVWRLKQGMQWHDGEPFTADDCVFNWEYAQNPETAALTIARYRDITVEKIGLTRRCSEPPTSSAIYASGKFEPQHCVLNAHRPAVAELER
jgi:ABC-type transport system substrate-binding protein